MHFTLIHIVWTVLLLAIFVGIVAWAWSGVPQRRFDAAARAPLDDDEGIKPHSFPPRGSGAGEKGSEHHG